MNWNPNWSPYGPPSSGIQYIPIHIPSEPAERKSLYDKVTEDLNGLKSLQKLLKEEKKDGEDKKPRSLSVGEAWSWIVLVQVVILQIGFLNMVGVLPFR